MTYDDKIDAMHEVERRDWIGSGYAHWIHFDRQDIEDKRNTERLEAYRKRLSQRRWFIPNAGPLEGVVS